MSTDADDEAKAKLEAEHEVARQRYLNDLAGLRVDRGRFLPPPPPPHRIDTDK